MKKDYKIDYSKLENGHVCFNFKQGKLLGKFNEVKSDENGNIIITMQLNKFGQKFVNKILSK